MPILHDPLVFLLACCLLAGMAYAGVWTLHNIDLTRDTIMPWADKQETFLQKMISCHYCAGFQLLMVLTTTGCVAAKLGLATWLFYLLGAWMVFLIMPRPKHGNS